MRNLLSNCEIDAIFDSIARDNAPRCSSAINVVIQQDVATFVKTRNDACLVLWVDGPAVCGKSALAQTLAEQFGRKKQLIGSFFFSEIMDGSYFVPTLVYQLIQAFPETRKPIERRIRKDPIIFQRGRRVQMLSLFCKPLSCFSLKRFFRHHFGKLPTVIIIDGLDHCKDVSTQCDILRCIAEVTITCHLPLRIIIFSRHEPHLEETFQRSFPETSLSRITLIPDVPSVADLSFCLGE